MIFDPWKLRLEVYLRCDGGWECTTYRSVGSLSTVFVPY